MGDLTVLRWVNQPGDNQAVYLISDAN